MVGADADLGQDASDTSCSRVEGSGGTARGTSAIAYGYRNGSGRVFKNESIYNRVDQYWPLKPGRPSVPGIVIYAQVDGGFSAWDPARNYWKEKGLGTTRGTPAYLFRPEEVWDGLPSTVRRSLCNGLILDWASWQRENGRGLWSAHGVLRALSPSPKEPLTPGKLTRIALNDARDQPTLATPYGQEVPLVLASAGMRRIVALAYMLVWTWQEHLRACRSGSTKPAKRSSS